MSYSSVILAESSLRHFWHMGADGVDLKSGLTLSYGSAVLRNVAGWDPDDTATVFDRVTNSYARADPAALSGAHSVEVLFSADPATMTNGWYIFGGRSAFGSPIATEWTLDPASNTSMRFSLGNGSTFWSSPANLAPNLTRTRWHHAVLAVGADGSWEAFCDRVSVGSGTWGITGTPQLFIPGSSNYLNISQYTRAGDTGWQYKGAMQDFAVYTSKLTLSQVQAHYDALPPTTWKLPLGELPEGARAYIPLPVGVGGGGGRPDYGQLWPR